jgi:hypothetical protein
LALKLQRGIDTLSMLFGYFYLLRYIDGVVSFLIKMTWNENHNLYVRITKNNTILTLADSDGRTVL